MMKRPAQPLPPMIAAILPGGGAALAFVLLLMIAQFH